MSALTAPTSMALVAPVEEVAVDTVITVKGFFDWALGERLRSHESVLEAETGVKPARWRAPLRAAGLDSRLCLQPRLSMRLTPRCGSTAHRDRRIEWFTRFQNTEAQHQQLTHRSHNNLLGFEAATGLQPRHQGDDRGVISHR